MNSFAPAKNIAVALFGLAMSALMLLCVAPQTLAQEQAGTPQQQEDAGQPKQGPGNNLMQQLSLTPEQRLQLREIRRQSEPQAREFTRRVRLARRALDESVYSDAVDEALIEQRARELAAAQAALVRLRAETELKVRRVLTPDQLRSFRNLRIQAQRRQMLQRRLRNGQQQQQQSDALDQNPQGAGTPANTPRDLRPADTPRARRRNRLGRP